MRPGVFFLCAAGLWAQPVVIQTGTLLDGRGGVLKDQQIVIEGAKIRAVNAGTAKPTYDLRGYTVMPGWIDTHIHLNWHLNANGKSVNGGGTVTDMAVATASDAYLTLEAGFTTVQSVGSAVDAAVRDVVARGLLPGPRILTSLMQIQQDAGDGRVLPGPDRLGGLDDPPGDVILMAKEAVHVPLLRQ